MKRTTATNHDKRLCGGIFSKDGVMVRMCNNFKFENKINKEYPVTQILRFKNRIGQIALL